MSGKSLAAGETVKLVKTQVKVQNACPPSHFPKLSIGTGVYWSLFLGRLWSLGLMIDTPVTLTQPNSVCRVVWWIQTRPAWTKHGIYKCTTHRPDMSWLGFLCSILMFFKGIFHQFNHKWYKKSHITMTGNSQLQNTNTYVVYSGLPDSHYSEREQDLNVNDWKEAWKTMRGFTKQMKDERMKGKEGIAGWWRTEVGEEKEGSI